MRRRKGDGYQAFLYFRRGLAWPIRKMVGLMHHILTGQMLIGIEVAIEYMLGLTYSPQVAILPRNPGTCLGADSLAGFTSCQPFRRAEKDPGALSVCFHLGEGEKWCMPTLCYACGMGVHSSRTLGSAGMSHFP